MKVFLVLQCYSNSFSNDWDTLQYYADLDCLGVYTTVDLAKQSVAESEWIETQVMDECFNFRECWKSTVKGLNYFIIERKLIVK